MDHRLTAEDTFFHAPAHLFSERSHTGPDQLINNLERALRHVAALPHNVSPVVEFAHQTLAEYQRLNAADRLGTISAFVADRLGVGHDQLMSRCRSQRIAFCRQVAMYVCRAVTEASFPTIGTHFKRAHSDVHHAFNLIDKRVRSDPAFRHAIEKIQRDIYSPSNLGRCSMTRRPSNRKDPPHATAHEHLFASGNV
jgi:Bacterial dnaA protein helix-turn-helix